MIRTECKRGDIYLCDLGEHDGHVQGGSRPVIVLSKNNYSRSPTVIVAPITTKLKSHKLKTHIRLNREFGLKEPSLILTCREQEIPHLYRWGMNCDKHGIYLYVTLRYNVISLK